MPDIIILNYFKFRQHFFLAPLQTDNQTDRVKGRKSKNMNQRMSKWKPDKARNLIFQSKFPLKKENSSFPNWQQLPLPPKNELAQCRLRWVVIFLLCLSVRLSVRMTVCRCPFSLASGQIISIHSLDRIESYWIELNCMTWNGFGMKWNC